MEKKQYIAPEIIVTELDGEALMLTISASDEETGLQGTTYGGTKSGIDADTRGRRGKWGNLWEE
jgi:hypothetical protein